MKKITTLTALSLLLVGGAFAQAKKDTTPKEIACAVMTEDKVDVAKATKDKMFADYKGRRYFFCCAGCPDAFKKSPEKFAKNASIPTPKAPTKK